MKKHLTVPEMTLKLKMLEEKFSGKVKMDIFSDFSGDVYLLSEPDDEVYLFSFYDTKSFLDEIERIII
jgi:hypothetical protein